MMRFLTKVVIVAIVAVVLVTSVNANPVENKFTMVFFEHGGKPVDDTVNYSMNCYGSHLKGWPTKKESDLNSTGPELVFHYSLNCQPNGCPLYNPFNTWILSIKSCDLEGTYKGKSFIVRNFSSDPTEGSTCQKVAYGEYFGNNHFYSLSFEDDHECFEQLLQNESACDQYLQIGYNDAGNERYVVRNNTKYTMTREYSRCRIEAKAKRADCEKNHGRELNATYVLQNPMGIPDYYCEQRFVLPSDNQTLQESANLTRNTYTPTSPVSSLYCSLLSLFGAKC